MTLPDDLSAGDTISGTVTSEPTGKDEKEKRRNADELKGYVVQIGNQRSPLSGGVIQRVHLEPAPTAPTLILLDEKSKPVGNFSIPIASGPPRTNSPNFVVSSVGQAGRTVQVYGPFDGDSSNTNITIGGVDAKVIAESPRKAICESPRTVVGPTNIDVAENGAVATGAFRNLKIDLTAPKTSLLKGESTELHVEVQGLQGLTQPVPVQVQNLSPSTVNLSGGNTQTINIQPTQVQAGGTFPWSTTVTATGNGGFSIKSSVPTGTYASPNPAPPSTSPSPSPSPPLNDTVVTRPPSPNPPGGRDTIEIELVQLQLKSNPPMTIPVGAPSPTDKPIEPMRPNPIPSPTPEPTPPPRYVPTQAPTPPDTRPNISGSGQRIIPKPAPSPPPTPSPSPCSCDKVTIQANDADVKVNPGQAIYIEQNGKKVPYGMEVRVSMEFDHRLLCNGTVPSEECMRNVIWEVKAGSVVFDKWPFAASEAGKEIVFHDDVSGEDKFFVVTSGQNYQPFDLRTALASPNKNHKRFSEAVTNELILKGDRQCTDQAHYTVDRYFLVKYPSSFIERLRRERKGVALDVGQITMTTDWSVNVSDCPVEIKDKNGTIGPISRTAKFGGGKFFNPD